MAKSTLRILLPGALALALLGNPAARAADSGDYPANTVRIGLYDVFYHVSADDISGPYVPPGLNLDVKDVQTLYVAYVRRLASHFHLELAFGWPPLTKTVGQGPTTVGSVPYNGQIISTARWFSPSLVLNYLFLPEGSLVRPYLGVGVNYTRFYDRDSTAAGDAASGGPTQLSLTSSVGPIGLVGLAFRLAARWSAYVSYSFSNVHTSLRADTDGEIRTTKVSFGPEALVVAAGYSF
jgi:outer membrane protein